mmetsp:Transcript_4093/g.12663  ORF Transcript_4093/g.12663 Transcript_4093/m.12663 type:complete len:84 (-) Transcript_4093:31-282(-)
MAPPALPGGESVPGEQAQIRARAAQEHAHELEKLREKTQVEFAEYHYDGSLPCYRVELWRGTTHGTRRPANETTPKPFCAGWF